MTAKLYLVLLSVIAVKSGGDFGFSQEKFGIKKEAYEKAARRGIVHPVIGVSAPLTNPRNLSSPSYIPASYIKFLEGSGAQVIPIPASTPVSKLKRLLPYLNGYALPGGISPMLTSPYYHHATVVLEFARKSYKKGSLFPVIGICLGLQTMLVLANNGDESVREYCDSNGISLPLTFTPDVKSSRLFGKAPEDIMKILSTEDVTHNHHIRCMTPSVFQENPNMKKHFKILSTNKDRNGKEFISIIEGIRYPFFGLQWHPEKVAYEFLPDQDIPHFHSAIRASQYIGNTFVELCRKNKHYLPYDTLKDMVIANYCPRHTSLTGNSIFEEQYFFPSL